MKSKPASRLNEPAPYQREWDGLRRRECEFDGEIAYYGTRDAFVASSLVPAGTPFPGDSPKLRVPSWKDSFGRRHSLSRYSYSGDEPIKLSIKPSAYQARLKEEERRVSKALASVDKEISSMETSAEEFRSDTSRWIYAISVATKMRLHEGAGSWKFPPDLAGEVDDLFAQMRELIETAPLIYDDTALTDAKKRRAALTDQGFRRSMLQLTAGGLHG